jgi:ferredoxin-thioredoxin reductase catalytic subunit
MIYEQPDFPEVGRHGYRRSAYFKALIYKRSANIKYISDLIRDLESRPILAEMCGFNAGRIPDASRFSRFLTDNNNSEFENLFHASGKLLVKKGAATLDVVMADSKPIKANTKHNNPKNPNRKLDKTTKIKRNPMATLSYYSYIKQPNGDKKKTFTWFWGYRTHVLLSGEGIPLIELTLPNNRTDGKVAKALLKKFVRVYGQKKGRIFIGDAGYDERELYKFIVEELKAEPFIPLNRRNRQPDKKLGSHGLPLCQAKLEMKFAGISRDKARTRKKFRCPIRAASKKEKASLPRLCPIEHELFGSDKCYGCTAYIDVTNDHRSQVPRESKRFKDTYKCRTEAERYFSRLGPREVEEMSQYKYRAIRNQMTIAHLTLSLTAVAAALVLEQPDKIRCYKTFADVA